METTSLVQSITDEQIAEIERFIGFGGSFIKVKSSALTDLISRLRAAERDAALLKLYGPIIDEVERRAEKECCLQDRCDFTVTVSYDDYAAIDTAMKGDQQ